MEHITRLLEEERNEKAERLSLLNRSIEDHFGHLAPDEIDILAAEYNSTHTEMVDVTRVGKRKCRFQSWTELGPAELAAIVPTSVAARLRVNDTFLGTFGFRHNTWFVIYLSPAYCSIEFEPSSFEN